MPTSTMGLLTRSPNHEHDRLMPRLDIQDLFYEVVATCYPKLKENSIYFSLKGEARKTYGDFAFFGVVDICHQLREKDPNIFYRKGPIAIAKKIKKEFESRKFDMIKRLFLHEAGILTFSLEGCWMAKRINKMLNDGIDTWAPIIYPVETGGNAIFIFPTNTIAINPEMNADMVRAIYMKDALVNLYLYSGANVGSGSCDDLAQNMAQEHFTEIKGEIVSVRHQASIFLLNGPSNDVYTDLATLWYGVNTQKADVMVYMTPHRLRGYIEQCHIAAANVGWLPDDWEDIGTLTCCGFRTFSGEQQDMCDLWDRFEQDIKAFETLKKLGIAAGYTSRALFECAFKFTCLKRHRLAECTFKFEDIVDEEGNTFASLLKTRALVRSLIKNSPGRNLFKLNALAGKERELGLHFVEFTEVIEMACGIFVPHVLCEYLCGLSKLFMCCYREVWPGENMLGFCNATEMVMNKCFNLLGITPSSDRWTKEFISFFDRKEARATDYHIIPSSEDARNEHPNSRFEIFSMYVSVAHSQFEKGNVYGSLTVVDTCRLAEGWVRLDPKDDCHVSYFNREWYNAITIYNGSYIPLGNTSSIHSIPFSSSIKVELLIKATSEKSDQTYLLCNGSHSVDLKKFWGEHLNAKCGTIKFDREDGRILLHYVAIKDAVDTTMQLTFNPIKAVRLSGSIKASYGKDILRDCGFLGQYNAHIFRADPTTKYIRREKPHSLLLHKSALAVPANGCLRMQANLVDVDTKKRIVDEEVEFCESGSLDGVSIWKIGCDVGFFELRVNWIH